MHTLYAYAQVCIGASVFESKVSKFVVKENRKPEGT